MSKNRYAAPPTGWKPAESSPGHVVFWTGPTVIVSVEDMILVSTFRHRSGITVENIVDDTTFTLDELLDLAEHVWKTNQGTGDDLFDLHDKILHAEKEINR